MKKETQKNARIAAGLLAAFVLWTLLIRFVDVQAIGPRESTVGLAAVNGSFHRLTGVHMSLYVLTDWLGLVPVGFGMGFAILGLTQWIRRKGLARVDRSLLVLGGFYVVVMAAYSLFEGLVVNYRPILINGYLEASYPSSTTLLVMCVMPTAIWQLNARIKNSVLRRVVSFILIAFIAFMVIGRLVCGVHWLSDIIGGALLSSGLVTLYAAVSDACNS